jgi:hypothetical protein
MNLGRQLEGIVEYSEGMKPDTLDRALKDTIEHCLDYYAKGIEHSKKQLKDAQRSSKDAADIGSYRFFVKMHEMRREILERIIRGETTFSKVLGQVNIYYDQRDFNNVLLHAFSDMLGGRYSKQEECERLDSMMSRIYTDAKGK